MTSYNMLYFTTDDLVVYDITDCRLQLICGVMPDALNAEIALCVAASFTGKCLEQFDHSNILGIHVSEGQIFEG
jgi:hypothetical protein